MDVKRGLPMNARIIFFACTLTLSACASTPQAPMHVYNSAFLDGDGVVEAAPKDRSFDPLRTGDFPDDATIYVVRNDGRWTGSPNVVEPVMQQEPDVQVAQSKTAAPPAESEKSRFRPSLSVAAPSAIGGTQGVESESAPVEESKAPTNGYDPANAAEFVSAVYGMNSVDLPSDTPANIYKSCKAQGRVYFGTKPKVGDIVFFHNTFDANGDSRNNDWYTHVGMVQSVGDNATAEVVAWREGKVQVHHINLERPEVAEQGGQTLNSRLRAPGNSDAPFTQYYAGQLFAGFCGLLGEKAEFVLVENWQPGMSLSE